MFNCDIMACIKLLTDDNEVIKDFGNVDKEYLEQLFKELPEEFRENEQIFKLFMAFV